MTNIIRVVTFNIRYCKGMDDKNSLNRVASTLKKVNANIIGLQEVDYLMPRSYFQKQAFKLARHLSMDYSFAPNIIRYPYSSYGNATLSKYPIIRSVNIKLPGKLEQRGLQHSYIILPGIGPLHFLNTHLGLSYEDRKIQVAKIAQTLDKLKNNHIILTGDFNTYPHSPELKSLFNHLHYTGEQETFLTYPADNPGHCLDHIFVSKNWQVLEKRTLSSQSSDHLPFTCLLEFSI